MSDTYDATRSRLETYFDRTASDTWAQLTSDAPVSRIRATVRAGRNEMRLTLLEGLPLDMRGLRLLDAGCGVGQLAAAAAERGARVLGVDISASLLDVAADRLPEGLETRVEFRAGDMLDERHGAFSHVVAMDSLIHYETADIAAALARLAPRVRDAILFTVAPRTPLLAAMHTAGRAFPRSDRSPAIIPQANGRLRAAVAAEPALAGWSLEPIRRVARGFYISEAWELRRL